jgi:hypothetical protein
LSRFPWLDFLHKGSIHQRRPVNPNKTVYPQLFGHPRNRFSQSIGTRFAPQQYVFSLRLNRGEFPASMNTISRLSLIATLDVLIAADRSATPACTASRTFEYVIWCNDTLALSAENWQPHRWSSKLRTAASCS